MSFYTDKLKLALKRASTEFDRVVTLEEMQDPGKHRHSSQPRWFCMAYMAAAGDFSQVSLGKMFKRDHTTVLYGLRRAHGHDGKLIHQHEPLWTKEHFENLVALDGLRRLPPQPVETVNLEQLLAIGLRNLRVCVSEQTIGQDRRAA